MVVFNYSGAEINAKVVYYGPALSGKTTNLEYIYEKMPANAKGKMVSMKTRTDRTLFFDFLPLELGEINGYRTRILLYTVPGQVYYNATRKLVLKGADAVVFVADSSASKMDENIESLRNLEENLNEHGLTLDTIPWVIQYNKRDLPDALPPKSLAKKLNLLDVPSFEATATTGEGIYETFQAIGGLLYGQLVERLKNAQPAQRPKASADSPPARPQAGTEQPAEAGRQDAALSDVVDVALREVDGLGGGKPATANTPADAASQDDDFNFVSIDSDPVDDEDVGRVIDFEDTKKRGSQETAAGDFIVDPFNASEKAEAKDNAKAGPTTPPKAPPKAPPNTPHRPLGASAPRSAPTAPSKVAAPVSTDEVVVKVPVRVSRSQLRETTPIRVELEIQIDDD